MYMSQKEVLYTLEMKGNVEPGFTQLVWQKLEEQNKEFFQAYALRLQLRDQIALFNHLLEQQAQALQKGPGGAWARGRQPGPNAMGMHGSGLPGGLPRMGGGGMGGYGAGHPPGGMGMGERGIGAMAGYGPSGSGGRPGAPGFPNYPGDQGGYGSLPYGRGYEQKPAQVGAGRKKGGGARRARGARKETPARGRPPAATSAAPSTRRATSRASSACRTSRPSWAASWRPTGTSRSPSSPASPRTPSPPTSATGSSSACPRASPGGRWTMSSASATWASSRHPCWTWTTNRTASSTSRLPPPPPPPPLRPPPARTHCGPAFCFVPPLFCHLKGHGREAQGKADHPRGVCRL